MLVHKCARDAVEAKTVDALAETRWVTTIFVDVMGLEDALGGGNIALVQANDGALGWPTWSRPM